MARGARAQAVVVLDLATGEPLANTADKLPQQVASGLQWGADNATLFYLTQDATQRWGPFQLWRHGEGQLSLTSLLAGTPGVASAWKWSRKELSV